MLDLFNILILILQSCMTITLFVTLPALFLMRLLTVLKIKLSTKDTLIALLVPFSIGYFFIYKEENKYKNIYRKLLTTTLVIASIGILYTLYLTYL